MTDAFVSLNGARADTARLRAPFSGRWVVDLDYAGSVVPSGLAVVQLGALELHGWIDPRFTGLFVGHVKARVVAGAGGWPKVVQARSYHDDGGVRRATVLDALARDTGETIDTAGDKARLPGVDFTRLNEPGTAVLEGVLAGTAWRVDFDGVTRYGARPAAQLGAELLEVDPRTHEMTFGGDPSGVPIGAVVSDARLGAPIVVRELEVNVEGTKTRIVAWGILQ